MANKIKAKISSLLRKNLTENKVLATYEEEGVTYKVIDTVSSSSLFKSVRSLKFKTKDSDVIYTHSAVYTDPAEKRQPYLPVGQDIISRWCRAFSPESALVLGCAGCAIPRFLYLSCENIRITGVELLPLLIDIAKKYFFVNDMSDRFTLAQGDAFKYVKECAPDTEDIILVDIFDTNRLPEDVFSDEFIGNALTASSESSLILFNFIDSDPDGIRAFAKKITLPYGEKYMVATENRCFLALAKSKEKEKLDAFRKSLDNYEIIN